MTKPAEKLIEEVTEKLIPLINGYGVYVFEHGELPTAEMRQHLRQALTHVMRQAQEAVMVEEEKDVNNLAADPGKWTPTVAGFNRAVRKQQTRRKAFWGEEKEK